MPDPNVTYQLTESGAETDALLDKIGTDALTTTAQTLTGAVNELDAEVAQNTSDIADNALDISDLFALAPVLDGIADHIGSCEVGDLLIQWGAETVTPTANAVTVVPVTFDKAYANVPWLGVTVRSSSVNQITGLGCTSTSTTGTNLRFYRTNTTSTTLGWIAVGKKASASLLNNINPINLNPLSPTVVNEEEM